MADSKGFDLEGFEAHRYGPLAAGVDTCIKCGVQRRRGRHNLEYRPRDTKTWSTTNPRCRRLIDEV